MLFRDLVKTAKEIASTSSRLTKVKLMASLIRSLEPETAAKASLILTGKVFPPSDPRELNVSWSTLWRVINSLVSTSDQKRDVSGVDVGEIVRDLLSKYRVRRQATLFEEPLTVDEVYSMLEAIASAEGSGSKSKKEMFLRSLFSRVSPDEAWLLANAIVGETRLGLSEGLLIDSIAKAYNMNRNFVEKAVMILGDPYEMIRLSGRVEELKPMIFRPLKPMLAQTASSIKEAIEEFGTCAFEYKLDGVRVQVHKSGDNVKLFSRRLSEITVSIPDIVNQVKEGVRARSAILEGEIIAEDSMGRPRPFQVLMRRFRRSNIDPKMIEQIPLKLYLFDLILLDDESFLDKPYIERRRKLEEIIEEPVKLVPMILSNSIEEAEEFLAKALRDGHEGLMAKRTNSPYTPGVRGRNWLKIKRAMTLDLVIVAAERGYGRRHRWYSDYYLAARDPHTNEYLVVGKTFKGLTDEEFEWMTNKLKSLAIEESSKFIRVRPEIVVEVAFNEIQRSPKYESGLALRFARIVKIREDKVPEEADTIDRVRELYEGQVKHLETAYRK